MRTLANGIGNYRRTNSPNAPLFDTSGLDWQTNPAAAEEARAARIASGEQCAECGRRGGGHYRGARCAARTAEGGAA